MRKRRHRRWIPIVPTAIASCGPSAPPIQHNIAPAEARPHADVLRVLAADVVDDRRFARSVFYTWTTTDQIDDLRASRQLLVRDESPVSGASYLDQILHGLAQHGDPLATTLYTTSFAKMRFAWVTPWPTRAGWPKESYGDQLIRVTLKPEAWIVSVSTATGRFEVHDLADQVVPIDAARNQPSRIAAIYFVSDATQPPAPNVLPPTTSFREYALCNEAMIATWEVGTTRVAREVGEAAATVDAVVRYVETEHPIVVDKVASAWSNARVTDDPIAAYHAALALDSPLYVLEAAPLRALAAMLRATPRPPAIEGQSTIAFQPGTARKPPRIAPRGDVSFARPISPTAARP